MPLGERPSLRQVGLNIHGQRRVERYVMNDLWSLHVYRWEGTLTIGGRRYPIRPGSLSVEPPNRPLIWRYDNAVCPHYYAHFALTPAARRFRMPVVQDLAGSFDEVSEEMERIIALFSKHALRAEVRLWDLLLRLAGEPQRDAALVTGLPFAVQTAVSIIDNELRSGITVAELARRIGISHNQLTRLFKRSLGTGVAAHIRTRRLERARHLLERSSLPVNAIAVEVGMPDLQQFNKFIRRGTGKAPSALRRKP